MKEWTSQMTKEAMGEEQAKEKATSSEESAVSEKSTASCEYLLDVRKLLCPLPVIRVQEKIKSLSTGDTLVVLATDPGVLHDIPAWCRIHGHKVLNTQQNTKEIQIKIAPFLHIK